MKAGLTWLFGNHFQISHNNNNTVARRACVRINNFGNALKREGEELNYGIDSPIIASISNKNKNKRLQGVPKVRSSTL